MWSAGGIGKNRIFLHIEAADDDAWDADTDRDYYAAFPVLKNIGVDDYTLVI